jgi:transposase InsO family protein
MEKFEISERRACKVLEQSRCSQRYKNVVNPFENILRERVIHFAKLYGRYGYKKVTGLINLDGLKVGKDRVLRIWREEGLKVPNKQPKRARLWLADGSCIRLRPEYSNHVWSYDFVADRTRDGRAIKILNIIDEYSKECLISYVARKITSTEIIFILAELILIYGCPKHIRSDNGSEFVAKKLLHWFKTLEIAPLFIEPGSPWENGYCESFNGKMRYELLDGEIFYTLQEARVVIESWRRHYNTQRPHQSLGYRVPVPETYYINYERLAM